MDDQLASYCKTGWWNVAVRYDDFLDTIMLVPRKKFTHITNLHVIHHTIISGNAWFRFLFAPEGRPAFALGLNAFVHAVTYPYYFVATGPGVQPYLWWKM